MIDKYPSYPSSEHLKLLLQSLLLRRQSCRDSGTSLSGSIQVLQRDERSVDARELRLDRVVGREGSGDGGVVDGVAGGYVRLEVLCTGRDISVRFKRE